MSNNGWVPIGKKVDLGREVQGTLPVSSMDPLVQDDVTDWYNLGTSTDGLGVLEGKDTSNQLAFFRLKAGAGVTVSQSGNSMVITSTVLSSGTAGVMLTSTYDSLSNGIVNEARLADAVSWSNITGKPTTFPPSAHTHPESDVTNLVTDLAAKVPTSRLVTTSFSLQGGGALSADLTISLIGDKANVGPDMRYGTDPSSNLGWYPASVGAGDMTQAVYDKNANGIVDLAEAVTSGAITTAMLGVGAVTGVNIASATIPGSAFVPGAVATSLGYTPLNKAGDIASGQIAVSMSGPNISSNMYQGAHLLAETSGSGAGYPTIGLACLSGGANAGAVALWYQGAHGDIQLQYQDGTVAHLLSSISSIGGAQMMAGSIPGSALASGAASANLGFKPVDGTHGGVYPVTGPIAIQMNAGLAANSWSLAGLRLESPAGGGYRPQIGFYYPGYAASLYFEPTDQSMRFIDSGGKVRILLDSQHGVSGAELQAGAAVANIGYTPLNKGSDTMVGGAQLTVTGIVGAASNSWEYAPFRVFTDLTANGGYRAGIGFINYGANAAYLWLNTDGRLYLTDQGGNTRLIG
jgi:hypothetical protein